MTLYCRKLQVLKSRKNINLFQKRVVKIQKLSKIYAWIAPNALQSNDGDTKSGRQCQTVEDISPQKLLFKSKLK